MLMLRLKREMQGCTARLGWWNIMTPFVWLSMNMQRIASTGVPCNPVKGRKLFSPLMIVRNMRKFRSTSALLASLHGSPFKRGNLWAEPQTRDLKKSSAGFQIGISSKRNPKTLPVNPQAPPMNPQDPPSEPSSYPNEPSSSWINLIIIRIKTLFMNVYLVGSMTFFILPGIPSMCGWLVVKSKWIDGLFKF